jgi:hypothetical protein
MPYGSISVDQINNTTGYSLGAGNATAMKNRLINGAMVIDQRNAGASTTPTDGGIYNLDRWQVSMTSASKFSVQQNAGSVTRPAGFTNYLGVTSTSAFSVGTSEWFMLNQTIEGFTNADLGWGTANAKTITLSFWVRSSLTGTFGGVINNGDNTRGYPFTYTISSANTWTQISITIAGDTSGSWDTTNGRWGYLRFGLGVGSTYSGTSGSWTASTVFSATGAVSVVGTSGATWYITGVQLEVGSVATGFEYRHYGQELALCQRYYYVQASYDFSGGNSTISSFVLYSSTDARGIITFPVTMRSAPTLSQGSGSNFYSGYGNASGPNNFNSFGGITATTKQGTQLYIQGVSQGIQGGACWINCSVSGAFVAFSAEL